MKGIRGGLSVALALVGAGVVAIPANAAVSTIYVGNGPGVSCSDSGAGASALPYCTISKAASVVQPGQTVIVGSGSYPETVTITAKGTAAAPISFVGTGASVGVTIGAKSPNHAFVLSSAQHVTIAGFAVAGNQEAVLTQNAQDVTLDRLSTTDILNHYADVRVAGSMNVTISRGSFVNGIGLDSGTDNTVITTNQMTYGPYDGNGGFAPAIRATDATRTVIESNTITPACAQAVDLEGASTNAVIANNVFDTFGTSSHVCGLADSTPVTVAGAAAIGTTADYNLVYANGTRLYSWSGVTYSGVASFTTATGQGGHDLNADPKLVVPDTFPRLQSDVPYYPSEGSPEVDSGDATYSASTDFADMNRVDDPLVANTGTGSGYVDRGAFEFQDPIALTPPSAKHAAGGSPLDTTVSSGVSNAWSNQITYTYNFQDGSPAATSTAGTSDTVTHDFAMAGYEGVSILANDGHASTSSLDQNSSLGFTLGADYTPMSPIRMLDTRKGIGAPAASVKPNSDVTLTVGGVDGIPATGLAAVVMNVTVTQPTANGYLTVYPHGPYIPTVSNLNFKAGQTVPNLVTVMVTDGKISFHNGSGGTVHVIADTEGYYADSGSGYKTLPPVRVLDTRKPIGVSTEAPVPADGHITLDLSSVVPVGTTAVTMNVTVTNPKAGGYLTVYPDGTSAPTASNLNFGASQTVPNLVTVPVRDGKVDFQNTSAGTVDVIADLAGYYGDAASGATGGLAPQFPSRIYDTRFDSPTDNPKPVAPGVTLTINPSLSQSNVPVPLGVIINVTVTDPTASGYLTVFPDGVTRPTASNLNFSAGQTVPNLAAVAVGTNGLDFYNGSGGTLNFIVDLDGLIVPPLS